MINTGMIAILKNRPHILGIVYETNELKAHINWEDGKDGWFKFSELDAYHAFTCTECGCIEMYFTESNITVISRVELHSIFSLSRKGDHQVIKHNEPFFECARCRKRISNFSNEKDLIDYLLLAHRMNLCSEPS